MSRSFAAARTARRSTPLSVETMACWRRFLRHADKAARDPLAHGQPFSRAAKRAGKLALPSSQNRNGAELIALIRLGKGFAALADDARREAAPEVARLVAACRPLFETVDVEAERAVEPRKDIFG